MTVISSDLSISELVDSIDSLRSFTNPGDFHDVAWNASDVFEWTTDEELRDLANEVVELADAAGDAIDDLHDAVKELVGRWVELDCD